MYYKKLAKTCQQKRKEKLFDNLITCSHDITNPFVVFTYRSTDKISKDIEIKLANCSSSIRPTYFAKTLYSSKQEEEEEEVSKSIAQNL